MEPFNPPHKSLYRLFNAEFRAWDNMKTRCLNKNVPAWKDYGGRGIKICQRWLEGFRNFLVDMGPRPSNKHSIDRVNNDGNYEPSNCRWATWKEQCEHKRPQGEMPYSKKVTYKGETKSINSWAKIAGVSLECLASRLNRGYPMEIAMSHKKGTQYFKSKNPQKPGLIRKNSRLATYQGQTKSLETWSRTLPPFVPAGTIHFRLQLGWTVERALTTPPRKLTKRK